MHLFQCSNPDCVTDNTGVFVFEGQIPTCPKCQNGPPVTGTVAIIHFAYYAPTGHLKGYNGRRVTIACGAQTSAASPWEGTSNYLPMVNCPECKKSEIYKKLWQPDPNNPHSYYNNPNLNNEKVTT